MTEALPSAPVSRWRYGLLLFAASLVPLVLAAAGAGGVLTLFSAVAVLPLLIAAGIMQLLIVFFPEQRRGLILHLMAAILSVPAGFEVIWYPGVAGVAIGLILVAFLIAAALTRIVQPLQTAPGWRLGTTLGATALMMGVVALTWGNGIILGLLFGWMAFDLIGKGLVWVILGPVVEMSPRQLPEPAPTQPSEGLVPQSRLSLRTTGPAQPEPAASIQKGQ